MPIPHLALPLRLDGTRLAVVEQDTVADITQCVRVALTAPQGSREELPEFGLPDQAFRAGGASIAEIEGAIAEWEPRADADARADDSRLDRGVSAIITDITGGT